MKKLIILIFLTTYLISCPPLLDQIVIFFNKPQIEISKNLQNVDFKKIAKKIGFEKISFSYDSIPTLHIKIYTKQTVNKISTSIDLRPWFKNKKCATSWDRFYDCMNKKENFEDELLYRKLDREFVSKVICQKGCKDISFTKWHLKWISPYHIILDTEIGKNGDFKNVQEAKKTLSKINELLKKVIYGAKFPETFGEGKSEFEIYSENHILLIDKDTPNKIENLLNYLSAQHIIIGLEKKDIKDIANLSFGGKMIFYLSKECDAKYIAPYCFTKLQFPNKKSICEKKTKIGWHSVSNGNSIEFDKQKCPKVKFLR